MDFLEVWNVSTRYVEVVRPLRVVDDEFGIFCGKFPCTFLKTQILVRSCSRESPRTVVRCCILWPHLRTRRCVIAILVFSRRSSYTGYKAQNLDWIHPDDLVHPNSALLKSLLRHAKPGSASALTLPQLFLLFFRVAFFSTWFEGSWQS